MLFCLISTSKWLLISNSTKLESCFCYKYLYYVIIPISIWMWQCTELVQLHELLRLAHIIPTLNIKKIVYLNICWGTNCDILNQVRFWIIKIIYLSFMKYCKPTFIGEIENLARFLRTSPSRIFFVANQLFYAVLYKGRRFDRENWSPLTTLW
jgi:hypothetical protein